MKNAPRKLTLLLLAIVANFSVSAHADYIESDTVSEDVNELKEMVVTGREKNLIGIAGSASQGEVSNKQFEYRALSRNGELVEVVPGAVAT